MGGPSWHDNDTFWSDSASLIFNKQRLDSAAKEVEQAVALIQLPPSAAVLDLCCGVGRHSIELARSGFRVTGVDRNTEYLARARERAKQEGLTIEFVQSDMRPFRREAAFDGGINLLTSFGYFEEPKDDAKVLANLFTGLRPGGGFLMDIMGKEVMARIFRERDWHEEADGAILIEERKVRDDWNWADIRWIILRGGERREHRFSLRLYAASDLRQMFEAAGFRDVRAYGALDGRPYDHAADRLVIVGRKPA